MTVSARASERAEAGVKPDTGVSDRACPVGPVHHAWERMWDVAWRRRRVGTGGRPFAGRGTNRNPIQVVPRLGRGREV